MKDEELERIAREALKNCNFKDDDYDEADRELGIIKVSEALRKYQSRIEELEGKLFGQTEELLYLREHVTGGNDGLYLPPKQYNNLSETTKALESFYRKEFDKIKAALESTNSKLRAALEEIVKVGTKGAMHIGDTGYYTQECTIAMEALASKDEKGCGCAPGKFVRIHFEGCKNPKGEKA